jgi:hypothetical protein
MNPIPVNLATEDELSEAILLRVLNELKRFAVGTPYRQGGYGYLKKTLTGWNEAAKGKPFIVLTDLDQHECPQSLLGSWLGASKKNENLVVRVAVREVESWLIADSNSLSEFLHINRSSVPDDPDQLADPKARLVALARASRSKEIRDRIAPRSGSTATQGPDYNACLIGFVRKYWHIEEAASASQSLSRTVRSLKSFQPSWQMR